MKKTSRAIFAAGCFWELEKIFTKLNGVISTRCGYTGGRVPNPTHMEVSSGKTGHVHAVEIIFDSSKISYLQLLEIFFTTHDPSDYKQPPQFHSAIFYTNNSQKELALNKIQQLNSLNKYSSPIVTFVKLAHTFYPATKHHQHHWLHHQSQTHHFLP